LEFELGFIKDYENVAWRLREITSKVIKSLTFPVKGA
jgi:hypothetical protein